MKTVKRYGPERTLRTYSEVNKKYLLNEVEEGYDLPFPRYKVVENRKILYSSMNRVECDKYFCSVVYDRIMQLPIC